MARFEWIGGTCVNVDKVRTYYGLVDDPDMLTVELDNGEVLRGRNNRGRLEERLGGREFIVQVIPCLRPLYARYKEDDGKEHDYPVYYLGLCADGYVRPLDILGCDGVDFADDVDNYVGLYNERSEDEGQTK